MAVVTLQDIVKGYDGRVVLDGVTLELNRGEKVGLVGANGSGKTTLFRLIVGDEKPDTGTITMSRGLRIGYLPQEPDLAGDLTLIEAVRDVFAEHIRTEEAMRDLTHRITEAHGTPGEPALLEKYDRLHARFEAAGGYGYEVKLREVLGGLGFDPGQYEKPVRILSGGQKCRAALARLLLADAELLLLDEPTNHLDIDATTWLEKYLASYPGGAVLISHDRYLLDRVVGKIIEVENHRTTVFPTNYTNYVTAKETRRLHAQREFTQQKEWLTHQRDYINRVRFAKDSAKQARGRQKYLDRMEADGRILDRPDAAREPIKLRFQSGGRGGDMVVRCEKAAKGYGGVTLFRDLDFEMTRGEKVGIIGPNGVGKTTLLRLLLGRAQPDAGVVRLFENLSVGYYDQEHMGLDPTLSVIDAVRSVRPEVREAEARSFLAMFLFRGDEVFKRVGDLSGGEQSRVVLARLVWSAPQVLVLDEPTNHLDIPAREALEEALQAYPGAALIVSHDRYFLDRVVERLLVLAGPAQHEEIAGNWTTYAAIRDERESAAKEAQARAAEVRRESARRDAARKSGGESVTRKSRSKYAAQRLAEIEEQIMANEERLKKMESSFSDPALMKDVERARALHTDYASLRAELSELNDAWERAVESQAD